MNRSLLSAVVVLLAFAAGGAGGAELNGRVVADSPEHSAIVWIEGASGGVVPQENTVITHLQGGSFEPELSVGFVGNDFVFRNEDDTLHTTHLYLHLARQKEVSGRPLVNGATVYNIALPRTGMEVERPILAYHAYREETGPIEVKCNLHPDEKADLMVFGHSFATLTGEGGEFAIKNIPAGKHDVWVWHGGATRKWATVDFSHGGSVEQIIEIEDSE